MRALSPCPRTMLIPRSRRLPELSSSPSTPAPPGRRSSAPLPCRTRPAPGRCPRLGAGTGGGVGRCRLRRRSILVPGQRLDQREPGHGHQRLHPGDVSLTSRNTTRPLSRHSSSPACGPSTPEIYIELYHVEPFHSGLKGYVDCPAFEPADWEFGERWSNQVMTLNRDVRGHRTPTVGTTSS